MQIVMWGTYDIGKPRVRILARGLRENGVSIYECHRDVWNGVEDKSQLSGGIARFMRLTRWLSSYPVLIWCYLKAPKHSVVFVPYMGHLDVLVLWPFAKLRGARLVWDAFISLYNTVVEDRKIVGPRHPLALLVYAFEWLATRAADRVVLDTAAHADYFATRYSLQGDKVASVFVGAEQDNFQNLPPLEKKSIEQPLTVLFYGQFIPLHGIHTIVNASRQLDDGRVRWILIGKGQEEEAIRTLLVNEPIQHLEWHPWVPYKELIDWIRCADVCLGIFSESEKAGMVIPNKVFQIISAGRPLITRDSVAIRELLSENMGGVYLVPPNDELALVSAILQLIDDRDYLVGKHLYEEVYPRISSQAIGAMMLSIVRQ